MQPSSSVRQAVLEAEDVLQNQRQTRLHERPELLRVHVLFLEEGKNSIAASINRTSTAAITPVTDATNRITTSCSSRHSGAYLPVPMRMRIMLHTSIASSSGTMPAPVIPSHLRPTATTCAAASTHSTADWAIQYMRRRTAVLEQQHVELPNPPLIGRHYSLARLGAECRQETVTILWSGDVEGERGGGEGERKGELKKESKRVFAMRDCRFLYLAFQLSPQM